MGLRHAVITTVARDDLPDGGAGRGRRHHRRDPSPEPRVPDRDADLRLQGRRRRARRPSSPLAPDVLNHNIETVARLQRAVRPSAGYARSLSVLARAKAAGLTTKSSIIVGHGRDRRRGRRRRSPTWPPSASTSSPSASTCDRPRTICRSPAGGSPTRSTSGSGRRGDGHRPRRVVPAHPLALPRPRGGVGGQRD